MRTPGAHPKLFAKPALELASGDVQPHRDLFCGERLAQVLADQEHRALDPVVLDLRAQWWKRLRSVRRPRLVEHHDVEAFLRRRMAQVAFDQPCREVGRPQSAGARDPVAIDDEQLIRHRLDVRKRLKQILVVKPADAAAASLHETGADEREGPGAQADERHLGARGAAQEVQDLLSVLTASMKKTPDHHDVIEARGITQLFPGIDLDAATGAHRLERWTGHGPPTADRAAAIALVGSQPQAIEKRSERDQREFRQQNESEGQDAASGSRAFDGLPGRYRGYHITVQGPAPTACDGSKNRTYTSPEVSISLPMALVQRFSEFACRPWDAVSQWFNGIVFAMHERMLRTLWDRVRRPGRKPDAIRGVAATRAP
jgi:hypothetical protein